MDQDLPAPNTGNSGRGLGVLLSLGTMIMIIIVLLLSYFFARPRYGNPLVDGRRWANDRAIALRTAHLNNDGAVIGIDEETLDSFPKMLYSHKVCPSLKSAEGNEFEEANKCCSICLSDFKEPEVVRIIPDCGHMFHMECIDEWLRLHATCPICRTAPLPSRSSNSLAQEIPPTAILTALDRDSIRPFPV